MNPRAMALGSFALPKMMLGFVVRRCTIDVGHHPSAEEFAAWANHCQEGDRTYCLFGRPISVDEARLILRHRSRVVSARSAAPHESLPVGEDSPKAARPATVTSFAAAAARLRARAK